ncbi:neuropeptide S receptor-like [Orcinus orca]|uniref:neuropeptide S receptor-like n=1 Tax=Orcinus orca TaxID=9733 RepID=UPI0014427FA0|nr:neuropeptide S receptor-like [Orcinus orca]
MMGKVKATKRSQSNKLLEVQGSSFLPGDLTGQDSVPGSRRRDSWAQPHLTEGSPKSNGTGQTLDSPILCTETVTFTAVVEGEERGSLYYSFKTEQLITLWVLFVFTIVGNAIMLFSTLRRKRKSRMTFFVAQLAVTGT